LVQALVQRRQIGPPIFEFGQFFGKPKLKPIERLMRVHVQVNRLWQSCGQQGIGPHGFYPLEQFGNIRLGQVDRGGLLEKLGLSLCGPCGENKKDGQGSNEEAKASENACANGVEPIAHVSVGPILQGELCTTRFCLV